MAWSDDEIRTALRELGDRKRESAEARDSYGLSHRYRLNPTLKEAEVEAFERQHGVSLPAEYRRFLTDLGNGGAGPHYGIFPLGTYEERPFEADLLEMLRVPFDPERAEEWDGDVDQEVMQGAMIIATEGCALWYWLVVTGDSAGEVWYDARADGDAPEPVVGDEDVLRFRQGYDAWLLEARATWNSGS